MAIGTGGHTVTVEIKRGSMCSHGSCSHRLLPDAGMELRVEAVNAVGALEGEFVEISFETRAALWSAFLVYIVPILVGIGAYLLVERLLVPYPTIFALAAATGSMIAGLKRGNQLQSEYTVVGRLDPSSIRFDHQSCAGCPFH